MLKSLFARAAAALAIAAVSARSAAARVVRVDVLSRTLIAGGAPFGSAGAYERIVGRIYFAFDPKNRYDRQIVDLSLAPRNAAGEVEAWSDFVLLRPKDASRGADVALVDIVNRGGITTGVFNLDARPRTSPDSAAYYGDALLMRQGLTLMAVGWQWDVPEGGGRLMFHAPRLPDAAHITGVVRSDITIDEPTNVIPLGHRVATSEAIGYPPARLDDPTAVLYMRDSLDGARRTLPRSSWRFAVEQNGHVVDDTAHVYLTGGFQPGKIYEVVYTAKNPPVTGTGMAAIRDVASYLKNDPGALAHAKYAIGYGVSQTGRFIRQYLYQNFNNDEQGRTAFDGFFAHTAGAGRGSFNHRFAQPSRDAQPYSTFFYPTDVFPFTSVDEVDPITGAHGGLRTASLGRIRYENHPPKVFYVDGGYEYWGRAASLTHTTVDGKSDVGYLPTERRYSMSSTQHSSPGAFPPPPDSPIAGTAAYRGDPLDQRLILRALMVDLVHWVKDGTEPPASVYPTIAAHTLVHAADERFPTIGSLPMARRPYQPYRVDLGPQWSAGIIAHEPPALGAPYVTLVPRVDSLGNDVGGVRAVEIQVPLATYFPWQLRTGMPAAQDRLVSFRGTFVPLPRTLKEREANHDSRPTIAQLYPDKNIFLQHVDAAARSLVEQRFMLPEDQAAAHARMNQTWDWIMSR